jgi:AcrR family transcriptional regulator
LAGRVVRADARRNYEKILVAASDAIAQHGAEASLEEIARRAGVGSATLHRHFPSRQVLLEAVFHGRVEILCAKASSLAIELEPGPALVAWLRAVGEHAASNRGLAAALLRGAKDSDSTFPKSCHSMIIGAGEELLSHAKKDRAVRSDVAITDLLKLVSAISMAAEYEPDGEAEVDRLLALSIDGVRP